MRYLSDYAASYHGVLLYATLWQNTGERKRGSDVGREGVGEGREGVRE